MVPERSADLSLQRRPFGSWLLGPADQSPRKLRIRVQSMLSVLSIVTNVIGASVVFVLTVFVLPGPPSDARLTVVRTVVVPAYFVVAMVVGSIWSALLALRVTKWLLGDRPATRREQIATLRLPLQLTLIEVFLWLIATVFFSILAAILQPASLPHILVTMLDRAIVTAANSYLLSEFALRPIAARALADDSPPKRLLAAGLEARTVFFWAVGSGVPVVGLMLVSVFALIEGDVSATRLSVMILTIGAIVLLFGWILTLLSARSVVAPVRSVRNALTVIGAGELDVRIPVFDGTELGSLQAGFNRMAAGLRERERIRDLFGRYVGREVVREALTGDPLVGEERFVAVLFVDLVGSTELAATRPPGEVVQLLNRFFALVVDEVDEHGGFVNKFAGDAVLAVFGAPTELPDAAGSALRTGRALAERLREELPEAAAGIGVTAGVVVAGTIGDVRRYEYTVIGDPVNEAARLTELAKAVPGRVVASMSAVREAAPAEAAQWRAGDEVLVRGRNQPTKLAIPTAGI